jgi:hypothetical protein
MPFHAISFLSYKKYYRYFVLNAIKKKKQPVENFIFAQNNPLFSAKTVKNNPLFSAKHPF